MLPAATASDVGHFLPIEGQQSAATSLFYDTQALAVSYTGFTVTFDAIVDGVPMTGLTYSHTDLDAGAGAPFEISFNDANAGPDGNIDPASVDADYVADPRSLTGSRIRFRFVLQGGEIEVDGVTYDNVVIDAVEITVTA